MLGVGGGGELRMEFQTFGDEEATVQVHIRVAFLIWIASALLLSQNLLRIAASLVCTQLAKAYRWKCCAIRYY